MVTAKLILLAEMVDQSAVYCLNTLEVRDSTFQSNQAGNGGSNNRYENGGNGGNGGAIYAADLLLSSSTFTANLAGNGGNANAEDDVYAGNGGNGGALYVIGTLDMTQSSSPVTWLVTEVTDSPQVLLVLVGPSTLWVP
jgi:hypothetical protein